MRKTLLCTLIVTILIGGMAFGAKGMASSASSLTIPDSGNVTFADPALEAMICQSLGIAEGQVTTAQAGKVTRLNLSNTWHRYGADEEVIRDITGLEAFVQLEHLDLSDNSITDITPLGGLHALQALSLDGNPVQDISPLSGLDRLAVLILSGCQAQDYSPLSNLLSLQTLVLENASLTDVSPLTGLTNLKHLLLAGCPIVNYQPLKHITNGLESKDFTIALTLSALGFAMDDGGKQAIKDSETVSVRINHAQWGEPPLDWFGNAVRTVFSQDDYKIDFAYYPLTDSYGMMAFRNGNPAVHYVYHHLDGTYVFHKGDQAGTEKIIQALYPTGENQDILQTPMRILNATIEQAFGMTPAALYAMPFLPPTLKTLGFIFTTLDQGNSAYEYDQHEPHDRHVSLYKPPEGGHMDGRNIELYDDKVNGYNLLALYFGEEDRYHIALFGKDEECAYAYAPATGEYGEEYPDRDTVLRMLRTAFPTSDADLYGMPLAHFEELVQGWFGMGIEALYALPAGDE